MTEFHALLVEEDGIMQEVEKLLSKKNYLSNIKVAQRLDALRVKIQVVHKKIAKHPFYHSNVGGNYLH